MFGTLYIFKTGHAQKGHIPNVYISSFKVSFLTAYSHRIGDNRERRVVNKFSFSIAKINFFDCQNRYNGNRKRLI